MNNFVNIVGVVVNQRKELNQLELEMGNGIIKGWYCLESELPASLIKDLN